MAPQRWVDTPNTRVKDSGFGWVDATWSPSGRQGAPDVPALADDLYCSVAMLDQSAYQRARVFLEGCRELERAVCDFVLDGGPVWRVVDALEVFQNPDGGFGHGLEPDLLCGSSSAVATAAALRRITEVAAPPSHAMVANAIAWTQRTLDPHERTWRIVPTDAGTAPHAPWWDQEGLEERFNGFTLNPKADLVAHLYAIDENADGWLDRLAEDVSRELENRVAANVALDMHEIGGCVALLDAPHVPVQVRRRLHELLAPLVDANVARDAGAWSSYSLRPLAAAPKPGCAFAGQLSEVVHAELDYLIAEQAEDGGWWPTWSWDRDEEVWLRQRQVWAGVLTVDALTRLEAYGRLER